MFKFYNQHFCQVEALVLENDISSYIRDYIAGDSNRHNSKVTIELTCMKGLFVSMLCCNVQLQLEVDLGFKLGGHDVGGRS